MKKIRKKTIILCVLILLTLTFIWSNSLQSVPDSGAKSQRVLELVRPVLEPIVGQGNVTDHLVRKLAHFAEFALLGGEVALLVVLLRRGGKWQPLVNCLFIGLSVAVVDETIQIFSQRGSQLQDVWLDLAGAAAGIIIVLIFRRFRKKPNNGNANTPEE